MIAVLGNSPSSGSTLLADLLDSSQYTACGVELNLFSNKQFYDFDKFKIRYQHSGYSPSIHRIRNRVNLRRLHSYGLNEEEFAQLLNQSKDIWDFTDHFSKRFLALRGKQLDGIVFEKTPENINCIGEYLHTFPESYFVHIVRNPLFVYYSLRNREFPHFIATLSWLVDIAQYIPYKDHPRVMLIRYEDLIEDPFNITLDIIKKILKTTNLTADDIKYGYQHNHYRKWFNTRLSSWSNTQYGVIKNANQQPLSAEHNKYLGNLLNVKISRVYAQTYNISEISFVDALKEFQYYDVCVEQLRPYLNGKAIFQKTFMDYVRLSYKWLKDYRYGDSSLGQLRYYFTPIDYIN